jgi:transcriptional regulator of met regulon
MVANGNESSMGKKIMVSVSEEMVKALEQERKARKLETIPEAIRSVLGEYFKVKDSQSLR